MKPPHRLRLATAAFWRVLLETLLLGWVLTAVLVRFSAQLQAYPIRNAALITSALGGLWCALRWRWPETGGWGYGLSALALGLACTLAVGAAIGATATALGWKETLATSMLLAYLDAWLISALQLWISARWPSLVLAMGVGVVATVAGIMVVQSDWGRWYP